MPLKTKEAGDCRGSEADGSKSEKWCKLCYANGKFINPECTLEEMIQIVDDALKRDKRGVFMRAMAKKQIPRLERWRVE